MTKTQAVKSAIEKAKEDGKTHEAVKVATNYDEHTGTMETEWVIDPANNDGIEAVFVNANGIVRSAVFDLNFGWRTA